MKKVLLGLVAIVIVAVAGYFGFDAYMQHRAKGEVEAAFDQVRAGGAKASHGKVTFDVRSRTVTIADIVTESAAEPPLSIKIASLTAAGVSQTDPARFSADSIDIADVEVGLAMPTQGLTQVTYKVPKIAVKAYSGPAGLQRPPASSSLLELYRFGLAQLADMSATSITAPTVTVAMTFDSKAFDPKMLNGKTSDTKTAAGPGNAEVTYSGAAVEGLKNGKIASMKMDGFHMLFTPPAGAMKPITADASALVASDIDVGALAAALDPAKVNDDSEHRVYGRISGGPYVITSPQGLSLRIEAMSIDGIAFTPSRMQLPALMAMMPQPGATPPSPAQAREMMAKVAAVYEGVRVGNTELRGLSVQTPQGPVKLDAVRFDFANGKIGEMAVEGLDGRAPRGPVKLGRFALKSLDVAGFMRLAAQFAGQPPSAEQGLAMLPLLAGVEVKALTAPYKDTGKQVDLDSFSLDWGQFVGPIPSKLHLATKIAGPLDASDPGQQKLIAAGFDKLAIDADLGAAWTESSRMFALTPVKLEVGGLINASLRFSLANVPRETFSVVPAQAMGAAAQIEAGAIELTLHDLGGVDLAIADLARTQAISRDAARQAIVQTIRDADAPDDLKPAADALKQALVNFVETPGQTLVIKLTPLAKAPLLQLVQLLKTEPLLALAQFKLEASTGL